MHPSRLSVRLSVCVPMIYSKASISWTTGIGKTSAMWASIAVQRCSEGQSEAVWHRPVGPGWRHSGSLSQPGKLCAMKQSPSSKIRESKLWQIKEQFGRGLNLAATSVLGYVTVALASAVPELDSTLINKLIDAMRSFVFDGAVRSVRFIRNRKAIEISHFAHE